MQKVGDPHEYSRLRRGLSGDHFGAPRPKGHGPVYRHRQRTGLFQTQRQRSHEESLLPKGQEIAERIYERHRLLSDWLTALGVPPEIAAEDACRMEHVISAESFAAIKSHVAQSGRPLEP